MFITAGTKIEADILVVQVEEMDETLTKTVPDPEKTNCKEVQVGKAVEFECYICQKLFSKYVEVKGHIRKMHQKKEADETQRKKKNTSNFSKEDAEGEKRQRLEDEEGGVRAVASVENVPNSGAFSGAHYTQA